MNDVKFVFNRRENTSGPMAALLSGRPEMASVLQAVMNPKSPQNRMYYFNVGKSKHLFEEKQS